MKDTVQFLDVGNLMEEALRHAADSISEGGPLIPFVMSVTFDGERSLQRFLLDDLGASAQAAFDSVRASAGSYELAVVAVDIVLTRDDGSKIDALMAEGYGSELEASLRMALPYKPATEGRPMSFGQPQQIGNGENLLRAQA